MSEQRFEFKLKVNFIDEETGEEIYHKVLIDNSNGNEIGFDDMVGLLNEQQAIIEAKDKEIEESKITIQLYETDVNMRDNFLKSKGLYDEFLQCILE